MTTATAWVAQSVWSVPREWPGRSSRFASERFMDRFSERSFDGPTVSEAIIYSSPGKSCSRNPIGDTQRLAVQRKSLVLRCVTSLFGLSGPSAVVRRITFVVIDTFDRHTLRPWPHIGQKISERLPSFTNLNTASTVQFKVERSGIATTRLHRRPNFVFSRSESDSITSMCGAPFKMDASATLGLTSREVADEYDSRVAAVATTYPRTMFCWFNGGESAKSHAAEILGALVKLDRGYSVVSHAVSSHDGDDVVRGWRTLATAVSLVFHYHTQSIEVTV